MVAITVDIQSKKRQIIQDHGIDYYLQTFKAYLDTTSLTAEEKFEQYYNVRTETINQFKTI